MSSFINSAKHFNSIENGLIKLSYSNDFYLPYSLKDICPKWYDKRHYLQEVIDKEIKNHIDTVRELQVLCVTLQYKHHYGGVLNNQIEVETAEVKKNTEADRLTMIGMFKAIQCTLYQIEKEHLRELRNITENETKACFFLEEIRNALAHHIIAEMEEYKSTPWGI